MPAATATLNTNASSKKRKGIFVGFFGGKKRDKRGNFLASGGETIRTNSSPGKGKSKKMNKKGQPLNEEDRSI